MKILVYPQLGMRSYDDGRWMLSSDGHLVILGAIAYALPDEWTWTWLVPEEKHLDDAWEDGILNASNVKVRHVPWAWNALSSRFYFPLEEIAGELRRSHPDLIICEAPEHVKSFRMALKMANHHCPIITQFNHVNTFPETEVPYEFDTILRQIEGYIAADAATFPLLAARDSWIERAGQWRAGPGEPSVKKHQSDIWPVLFAQQEALEYGADPIVQSKAHVYDYTIFFISRLSDEDRTHWPEFFNAVGNVIDEVRANTGAQGQVWVANPNEALDWQQVMRLSPHVSVHPFGNRTLRRQEYFNLLWASDIVPILYPTTHICSVGYCEAAVTDNAILTVSRGGYETGGVGIIKEDANHQNIESWLRKMIYEKVQDPDRWKQSIEAQKKWIVNSYSVERNVERVKATIERVCKR